MSIAQSPTDAAPPAPPAPGGSREMHEYAWGPRPGAIALMAVAVVFSTFQLWTAAYAPLPSQVVRAVHVGFLLLLLFGLMANIHPERRLRVGVLVLLGVVAFAIGLYQWVFYVDIVITRAHVLTGNYEALYDEVRRFREACDEAHMKAILATGELATLGNVARASLVAMQAGADFIKTSTGKEGVNATIPFGIVMCRMIREYFEQTGYAVGFKPAGGIRTAKAALEFQYLMKEELGDRWLRNDLFRFGASGLLTDIERQLEHAVTGRYAAAYRHPMP